MSERGSTRHSARVDDELEAEVESLVRGAPVEARAQEWRQMEAAADGEPAPDAVITVDDVELRSAIATSLRPSAFPADRARLIEVATEEHAQDQILEMLALLPPGRKFENMQRVWEALGGGHESRDDVGYDGILGASLEPESEPAPAPAPAAPPPPTAPEVVLVEEPTTGRSLLSRAVGLAFDGVAVVVGATLGAARTVLRKR